MAIALVVISVVSYIIVVALLIVVLIIVIIAQKKETFTSAGMPPASALIYGRGPVLPPQAPSAYRLRS